MKEPNIEIFLMKMRWFFKNLDDLSEKIIKISKDEKLRKYWQKWKRKIFKIV